MYDVRMGLRLLHVIPIPGSPPTCVAFDPSSRMGQLMALGTDRFHACGIMYLVDGPNATVMGSQGVQTESGQMSALAISDTGEVMATGDSGGCSCGLAAFFSSIL